MHAWFPFRHLLYDTHCFIVQLLIAAAACYLKVFCLSVLLDNDGDDAPALNSSLTALLWVTYLVFASIP